MGNLIRGKKRRNCSACVANIEPIIWPWLWTGRASYLPLAAVSRRYYGRAVLELFKYWDSEKIVFSIPDTPMAIAAGVTPPQIYNTDHNVISVYDAACDAFVAGGRDRPRTMGDFIVRDGMNYRIIWSAVENMRRLDRLSYAQRSVAHTLRAMVELPNVSSEDLLASHYIYSSDTVALYPSLVIYKFSVEYTPTRTSFIYVSQAYRRNRVVTTDVDISIEGGVSRWTASLAAVTASSDVSNMINVARLTATPAHIWSLARLFHLYLLNEPPRDDPAGLITAAATAPT